MSKKSIFFIALLVISPVIVYLLWPTDEARIRKLFREGAKAVQEERLGDVMAKVSFNYTDEHGMSYLLIRQVMERVFKNMDNISVRYVIRDIQIGDKTATADLEIRVSAGDGEHAGYVLGDAGDPVTMRFFLEKERSWLVVRTEGMKLDF